MLSFSMHLFMIRGRKLQCENEFMKYMAYNFYSFQKKLNIDNIANID